MGFPPTGRPVEPDVIDIARFEGGRVLEHCGVPDQLGMMLQAGLVQRLRVLAGSEIAPARASS